ncbi:MAG: DUF3488 domain-containing protein [Phycisphaeraceae bacterium]|nr:DUF3488 domain-containing protein [Phycisphaeraceae bacterium]
MNSDRGFRLLVFFGALGAILTYAIADESILTALLAIPLLVVGWRVTERRGDRAVPRVVVTLGILIAIAWAVVSGMGEGLSVAHFCRFTISVLVVKSFDRRTSPDLGQFVMLSLFLSIGALLTSNSLWMALALIPTLLICVWAAVGFQFHLGRAAARKAAGLKRSARPGPGAERIPGLGRTMTAAWLLAGAISLAVFLMFPRGLGADAFGQWGNAGVGMVTGFTDSVNLGEAGLISTSSAPVLDLTVRTIDPANESGGRLTIGAPDETFYLRGAVLEHYQDGSWTSGRDRGGGIQIPGGSNFAALSTQGAFRPADEQTRGAQVELEIIIRNARADNTPIFTSWRPRFVRFENPSRLRHDPDTGVMTRSGQSGRLRYFVTVDQVDRTPSLRPYTPPEPPPSEAVRALARDIVARAGLRSEVDRGDPWGEAAAIASAIDRYFDEGFAYTLDIQRPRRGQDPIEWFLLEERQGHCEYYASAMAALCRSVGVNARVVTGYVATEFNEATQHYIVRESNAHAWVEVEIGPNQWQTRDPTPVGEFQRIHRPEPTLASRARGVFDAVNYAWITTIVAFDDESRTSLVSAMRIDVAAIDQWAEEAAQRIRSGGRSLAFTALRNGLVAMMVVACIGVAVVVGGPVVWQSLKPRLLAVWLGLRERRREERAARLAHAGFYSRLLAALARRGVAKPGWRPPLDHARGLEDERLRGAASRVVEAYYGVRYGRSVLSPEAAGAVEDDLRTVEGRG